MAPRFPLPQTFTFSRAGTAVVRRHRLPGVLAALTVGSVLLTGCGGGAGGSAATVAAPTEQVSLATDDPAELAAQAAATWFEQAEVAVVSPGGDAGAAARAASIAHTMGVPALIAEETPTDDSPMDTELARLGTTGVITVSGQNAVDPATIAEDIALAPAPADAGELGDLIGTSVEEIAPESDNLVAQLAGLEPGTVLAAEGAAGGEPRGEMPEVNPSQHADGGVAVSDGSDPQAAAVGTARAGGAEVAISEGLIGGSPEALEAVSGNDGVVVLGTSFGDEESVQWQLAVADSGVELPGGGQELFGSKRYIALYGSPGTPSLGLLGEQDTEETIARAEEYADMYRPLTEDTVVPSQEIIVTVASGEAGADGDYSSEIPIEQIRPLVDAAGEAGQYVILDFQPGRTHFLDQVKAYEELLREPHVGIALDPEWRLKPDQRHLAQVGQVQVEEVNEVYQWLADYVRDNELPPKILVLHQFQTRMIVDRENLEIGRPEVEVLIHADGQGSQPAKQDTWRVLHQDAPEGVYWGWKNFIDEDEPMLTPEQTYDQVEPLPEFVSYQ